MLSVRNFFVRTQPAVSLVGVVWLALTFIVMLALAWGKHRTGQALNNVVLTTEARVTLIDAALAAVVLTGVGLNALFGWWWSDSLAALVIVYYGIYEGLHAYNAGRAT